MKRVFIVVATLALVSLLQACSPLRLQETPLPSPVIGPLPTVTPIEIIPSPTATEGIPEGFTTHKDETYGYQFDYPSDWMLDSIVVGSRAPGGYQLTSWSHEPGLISEVQPGGTIMNILIQLWEPKGDLSAFIDQRKTAWQASGSAIVSEEDLTLKNGQPAKEFVLESQGQTSYTLISVLGDNYLVASGNGDIDRIRQVARSLR